MKKKPYVTRIKRNIIFKKHTPKYSNSIKGWSAIRETILERDNYACRICGTDAGEEPLNIHHIDYDRDHNADDNLVSLCAFCHRQVHFEQYRPSNDPCHDAPWGVIF